MKTTALSPKEQQLLDGWVEEVRVHEHSALKWAEALSKIKVSELWKHVAPNWAQYCEETFGYSKTKAYEWIQVFDFTTQQRRLAETNPDAEVPTTLTQAKRLMLDAKSAGAESKKSQSAKRVVLVPESPVRHDTTPMALKPNGSPVLPNDLRGLMDKIFKDVDHILHRTDISYEAMTELRKLYTEVNQARQMLQGILPGMEDVVSKPKFRRPSLEEVQLYCEKAGICGRDADWFWNKMEGTGWKNGGKPVVDWGRTLIAWKLAAYLPSMKTFTANGQQVPKPKTIIQQDMDRLKASMSRL